MAVADLLKAVQIKANLIADKQVGLMEIDAEVHDGVAVLTGDVTTEEEKRIAEEIAYEIEGIHDVHNEIRVVPVSTEEMLANAIPDLHLGYGRAEGNVGRTPFAIAGENAAPGPGMPSIEQFPGQFSDDEIESEVREKLDSQSRIDVSDIQFCSANQVIFMKGSVKTSEEMDLLRDMVLSVRGVMGISSEVSVTEGEAGTPTP
jgi:osmotically-inducible protein OsmY